MNTRTIGFRWLPYDGKTVFDPPGQQALIYDGPITSAQMSVLITADLAATNGELDPEELVALADRIEYMQAGKPWPANVLSGVDGFVYFSQGVVLVGSSTTEDSVLLIDPDELKRVLRAVHAVFAGPDFRDPEAAPDDISFEVIVDGQEAMEEYKRLGGETTRWAFDPKKCTFTYEGQPEDFDYPNPVPPGYQELCD